MIGLGATLLAPAAELGDDVVTAPDGDVVDARSPERSAQLGRGDQLVVGVDGRHEHDLGRGGHRGRRHAVACAGKGGVGEREQHATVGDVVAIQHVAAHLHSNDGATLAVIDELDPQPGRDPVALHHPLERVHHWPVNDGRSLARNDATAPRWSAVRPRRR
jgi:hypothetical protein